MPATGNYLLDKGYDADEALTIYRAVKAGAADESVQAVDTDGEGGMGIAQFGVTAAEILKGKGASVRIMGASEWEAGAIISRGDPVTVDSVGRCKTAVFGDAIWGSADQDASGAGVRIRVTLSDVKVLYETFS